MKTLLLVISFLTASLFCNAQDTLNNFKIKVGLKLISEHSSLHVLADSASYNVLGIGIPFIIRLGQTHSSLETGLYLINKKEKYGFDLSHSSYYQSYSYYYHEEDLITFHYLRLPINYRLDTRLIYFSAGICVDNLLSMSSSPNDTMDFKEFFPDRKFKLAADIHIGIEKELSKQYNLFAEVRFSSDIPKEYFHPGFSYENGEPIQLFGFALGINFKFPR